MPIVSHARLISPMASVCMLDYDTHVLWGNVVGLCQYNNSFYQQFIWSICLSHQNQTACNSILHRANTLSAPVQALDLLTA